MKQLLTKKELKNLLFITSGTFCVALGVVLFFIPNHFTTGGTPGMAILLHHITGFSTGSMVIAINIPLLILGIRYLGKLFAIRTILAIILTSAFIDGLNSLNFPLLTDELFLATLFGGAIIGFGVGLTLKGSASSGGNTIIARILTAKAHIASAKTILVTDFLIVASSLFVFKDVEKTLWSLLSVYVIAKVINTVLTGTISTKVVHITSNKVDILCQHITKKLGEHGTILNGSAILGKEDKNMIFLVVDVKRIAKLKNIIEEHDEDAFMIVMEASEMLGRGH